MIICTFKTELIHEILNLYFSYFEVKILINHTIYLYLFVISSIISAVGGPLSLDCVTVYNTSLFFDVPHSHGGHVSYQMYINKMEDAAVELPTLAQFFLLFVLWIFYVLQFLF